MRVFITTNHPFPQGMAMASRIICYAKALTENGIECKVLTSSFNSILPSGVFEDIEYKVLNCNKKKNISVFYKLFYRYYNSILLFKFLIKYARRDDIILLYANGIFIKLLVLCSCAINRNKVCSELCEYPYTKQSFINTIFRFIELNLLFRHFDGFIVISENLENLVLKHRKKTSKIIRVPILVNKSFFNVSDVQKLKYCDLSYIFYAGTISEQKDGIIKSIEAFIAAFKKLPFPIYYLIAGPSSKDLEKIFEIVKRKNFESYVIYLGELLPYQVLTYLKNASLFISNKYDNLQNRYGFSTKIGEVLMSGIPIITTNIGESSNYLVDNNSAYIVEPNKNEAITEKIIYAFTNKSVSNRIAENGKKMASINFDYSTHGQRLYFFFQSL